MKATKKLLQCCDYEKSKLKHEHKFMCTKILPQLASNLAEADPSVLTQHCKSKKLWPHFDFGSHVGLRLLPCVSFEQHVQNMCESQLRHLCPVQFDPLVKGVPQGVQDLACLLERFPTRGWAHFDKRLRPAMHSHQKRHDWRHRDHFLRLSRHDGAVSCVKASNTLPFTHPDEVHA